MESDYEHTVQELSAEKEALGNEKVGKEKENQELCGEIGQLKEKVLNLKFTDHVNLVNFTVHSIQQLFFQLYAEAHHHELHGNHADILLVKGFVFHFLINNHRFQAQSIQ